MLAQVFAARHTSLLHTLILGCTLPSITSPQNPPVVHILPMPESPPRNAAERRALVVQLLGLNYTEKWVEENQERFQWLVDDSIRWSRPMRTTIKQSQAIGRFDGLATIDKIKHLPILIIHGTKDGVIPVTQAHALAERLPQADLVILPEVGHLFWNQAEKETQRALQVFLSKHEEHIKQKQLASKL
jgi:pimeloyl-ACP methyl ester carboxylesterase